VTGSRVVPLLVLVLLLVAGCGMYGSLYLEEEPGTATPEVTERPPTAGNDADDDEEDTAGRR
jgi:predicted small lipoprotein YifL